MARNIKNLANTIGLSKLKLDISSFHSLEFGYTSIHKKMTIDDISKDSGHKSTIITKQYEKLKNEKKFKI